MTATETPVKKDPILIIKTERNSKIEFHKFCQGDQIGDIVVDEIVSLAASNAAYSYIEYKIKNIPNMGISQTQDRFFSWYGDIAKSIYDYISFTQMKHV